MLCYVGVMVDQDGVAARAGTVLPRDWRDIGNSCVPPGAESRTDYRVELGVADLASSGTQPAGLAAAIEELSGGALAAVPARSEIWTSSAVSGLVERGTALGARLLANLRSGRLWGSRPPAALLLAELEGAKPAGPVEAPPPADWDVGHFVELVGLLRGRAGGLVLVRDSYPTLGWDGHYLQPPRVLADALQRGDGRDGGVLLVVPGERRADAVRLAGELALHVEMWDN